MSEKDKEAIKSMVELAENSISSETIENLKEKLNATNTADLLQNLGALALGIEPEQSAESPAQEQSTLASANESTTDEGMTSFLDEMQAEFDEEFDR